MSQEDEFCKLINDGLKDESGAKEFYLKLLSATSEKLKDDPRLVFLVEEIVNGIASDEEKHYNILKRMREKFCKI